ncbi:MAG: TRAP transporter large permease subunit [Elusimicrobia bacterium]|nr:TRAP transporter large permease subunit [Elusimicrobiota bacterium]
MILAAVVFLVLLALLGAPIFLVIGAGALIAFHSVQIDSSAIIVEMYRLASLPALMAIPLFTFSGFMLAKSQSPQRLLRLANALFGWVPGGVAVAALVSCAVFTAFTGASGVTIIALGGILYPILLQQNYSEKFTLGLLTTTGSLGLLFPPSLPIILYGLIAKVSIDKLFLAGLAPGIFLIFILSLFGIIAGARSGFVRKPFSFSEVASSMRESIWEIPLPFLIIGGIYGGFFTATEASAIMAFYVVLAETWIYRDIRLKKDLPGIVVESLVLVGAILMVMGLALGLTNYLIDEQIPMRLFEWVHRYVANKTVFLLILNLFLLVMNMIEMFSAIIIVVPLIVPVALEYGIDPIHLGIIFLLNLEIGYMTAPFGLNLFLSSMRFGKPVTQIYSAALPFWLILMGALALVTYVPQMSLFLLQ